MALDVLSCSIRRPLKRRLILDRDKILRLFDTIKEIYEFSTDAASDKYDRESLSRNPPKIALELSDGSSYASNSVDLIDKVHTDSSRLIEDLSIISKYGVLTASVRLTSLAVSNHAVLSLEGPEDKAQYYAQRLERILTEQTDITVISRRIWPTAWALILIAGVIITLVTHPPPGLSKEALAGLVGAILSTGILVAIPIHSLRDTWLPPVSFEWGRGQSRAKIAKVVCGALLVGIPLWFVGNFAASYFFG
jgi:hypothetical protein